jgi:hypothetical protein
MLIVLNWGEQVYGIRICVSVWKSGGELVTYVTNGPIGTIVPFDSIYILSF